MESAEEKKESAESESGAARLEHARLGGAVDPDALQVLLRRRGLRRRNRRAHVEQQPLCALELRQQPPQASRAGSGRHARLHGLLLGAARRTLLAVRTREADGRAKFVDRAKRIKDHIVLARRRSAVSVALTRARSGWSLVVRPQRFLLGAASSERGAASALCAALCGRGEAPCAAARR